VQDWVTVQRDTLVLIRGTPVEVVVAIVVMMAMDPMSRLLEEEVGSHPLLSQSLFVNIK